MKDWLRESLSYFGLYSRLLRVKRSIVPACVPFGNHKNQYLLHYAPGRMTGDKVIVWVHGGGWNAGSPRDFDFVGQCVAGAGYHFISLGYRLSPANRYPCQIEDVCRGYQAAMQYLKDKGVDTSRVIVSGPSAGAHLATILCTSRADQERYSADVSNVVGLIGVGGPYCFSPRPSLAVRMLLDQLFERDYDRTRAEPYALMTKTRIPMLLIHSRHDGLIDFSCAQRFCEKAQRIGNACELYEVVDRKNTHSWYTAGIFLMKREENRCLHKLFSWIEAI